MGIQQGAAGAVPDRAATRPQDDFTRALVEGAEALAGWAGQVYRLSGRVTGDKLLDLTSGFSNVPDADKAAYFQAVFPGTPGYEHRVGAIVALHFAQLYVIWAIEMGALGNRRACSDSLKRADGYLDEVRHHLHDIIDRAEKRRPHPSLLLVRRYHAEHIAADSARLLKVWGEIHDILDAQDLENLKHNPTLAARCGLGHLIAPGEVVVKNRDSTFVHVPGEGTKGGAA